MNGKAKTEANQESQTRREEWSATDCGGLSPKQPKKYLEIQEEAIVNFETNGLDDSSQIKAFPLHCLPDDLREFVEASARVAMVPESMAATVVLGVMGVSVGGGLEIKTYKGSLRANLFILISAKSGTGKDSIFNLINTPLNTVADDRQRHWRKQVLPSLKREQLELKAALKYSGKPSKGESAPSPEEAERMLARLDEVTDKIEVIPRLTTGDTTREKLALDISQQPGEAFGVMSSEGRGVFSNIKGRYSAKGTSDEDFYSSGYSGSRVEVTRIGRPPVTLEKPCLSLLLMTQPDNFNELVTDSSMVESGCLPRFLLFDPKAEPQLVPEIIPMMPERVERSWRVLVEGLIERYREAGNTPQMVIPSPEAMASLRNYNNDLVSLRREGQRLADVNSFAARWAENAWKIALCLHVAQHPEEAENVPLSEETANNSIEIMYWFSSEQLHLLETGRQAKRMERADKLRTLIERSSSSELTLRSLKKSHGFTENELTEMEASNEWLEITQKQNPKGGPASLIATIKK